MADARWVRPGKQSLLSAGLLLYVVFYVVTAVVGVNATVQPTSGYYYAPLNYTAWDPDAARLSDDTVTLAVNVTDEHDGSDVAADFYLNASYNGTVTAPSGRWHNLSVAGIPDGRWHWWVNATEQGDGEWNTSALWNFTVDTMAPRITVHAPSGATSDTTPWLNVTASDTDWRYNLDGAGNISFVPNRTLGPLNEGDHALTVWAGDAAGNWAAVTVTFTVDTTPPSIDCDGCASPDPVKSGSTVSFDPTVTDATATTVDICRDDTCSDLYCSGDPCGWVTPDNTVETYEFWVAAEDAAGNADTVGPYNFTTKKWLDDSCQIDDDCLIGRCESGRCSINIIPAPQILIR